MQRARREEFTNLLFLLPLPQPESSLNKMLTAIACFVKSTWLFKLYWSFRDAHSTERPRAVPVQSAGQALPDLLKTEAIRVNYTTNIHRMLAS